MSDGQTRRAVLEAIVGNPDSGVGDKIRAIELLERLALSISEAAAALGVSPDYFREHVQPELRIVRRGRRRLVLDHCGGCREVERIDTHRCLAHVDRAHGVAGSSPTRR